PAPPTTAPPTTAPPRAVPPSPLVPGPGPEPWAGAGSAGHIVPAPRAGTDVPALLSAVDVFVSASRDEAFGLAVVEALAAGLPVLHSTCPAVDDLPAWQSPGARRFDGTAEGLTAALDRQRTAGRDGRRCEPPPVVRHYDIARSSALLQEVYAQALAAPPPAASSTHPTEGARP
ncbi:glycosyltransferase, partial [Streptomyces sp. NPDC055078]